MAYYKVNTHQSVVYLSIKDREEREQWNNPTHISLGIQYLGINLIKEVKDI